MANNLLFNVSVDFNAERTASKMLEDMHILEFGRATRSLDDFSEQRLCSSQGERHLGGLVE